MLHLMLFKTLQLPLALSLPHLLKLIQKVLLKWPQQLLKLLLQPQALLQLLLHKPHLNMPWMLLHQWLLLTLPLQVELQVL